MAPSPASRLLVLVHLSSERAVEPVRRDSPFAEKQESHLALLLVVPSRRLIAVCANATAFDNERRPRPPASGPPELGVSAVLGDPSQHAALP
jgi:hypothetical protein